MGKKPAICGENEPVSAVLKKARQLWGKRANYVENGPVVWKTGQLWRNAPVVGKIGQLEEKSAS